MIHDPICQYDVASARHRARLHDAALRHVATTAADRRWRRRPTRHP